MGCIVWIVWCLELTSRVEKQRKQWFIEGVWGLVNSVRQAMVYLEMFYFVVGRITLWHSTCNIANASLQPIGRLVHGVCAKGLSSRWWSDSNAILQIIMPVHYQWAFPPSIMYINIPCLMILAPVYCLHPLDFRLQIHETTNGSGCGKPGKRKPVENVH